MKVSDLGLEKDLSAVVVLGAGASRGASFVTDKGVLPPLDADFFEQAQRLPVDVMTSADRKLFEFVKDEFGKTGFPTLETFFTQLEAVDRFHHEFNIKGRVSTKFGRHLITLRRLIPRVFSQALGNNTCRWHHRLASSLRTGDCVLSFNYDCLIDMSLRLEGGKRWRADSGYGFDVSQGGAWSGVSGVGAPYKNPVKLLKPHGSLNWVLDQVERTAALVEPYGQDTQGSIVPPTWQKGQVAEWPWNEVWREARRSLAQARLMVVIGFSVPLTDQLTQALLRADVSALNTLVVVNPDPMARNRVKSLLSSALSSSSTVIELNTLEQFAEHLPRAPSEGIPLDLPTALTEARSRIQSILADIEELELKNSDHESHLDDIRMEMEELKDEIPDPKDELRRLEDRIDDLEARLDSL